MRDAAQQALGDAAVFVVFGGFVLAAMAGLSAGMAFDGNRRERCWGRVLLPVSAGLSVACLYLGLP